MGFSHHREMHSRYEIALEQYILTVDVEARLTLEIATTTVLPAALRYQTELATNVASLKDMGMERRDRPPSTRFPRDQCRLREAIDGLRREISHDHVASAKRERPDCQRVALPAMAAVRAAADELESLVADDLWPLATYQEMLFILLAGP